MHKRKGFTPLEIEIPNRESGSFLTVPVSPKDSFRRKKFSDGAGFTLIELLTVISIIVLLVAILLPTLQRVKKQAKAVICQSNLKQWGAIFTMYTDNNDGLCPRQKYLSLATPAPWMYLLQDYSAGPGGISCCPMATKIANPNIRSFTQTAGADVTGGTFLAWGKVAFNIEGSQTPAYYGSYGMNNWLSMPQEKGIWIIGGSDKFYNNYFWRTANLKGAGNIPVYLDSWWWCAWVKEDNRPPVWEGQKTDFPCGCINSIRRFCINRHDGFVNAVFWTALLGKSDSRSYGDLSGIKTLIRIIHHRPGLNG